MECAWLCSFPGTEPAPGMAPSWHCFFGFSRARQLTWAEGLVHCSKVPTRRSSICAAWARNCKQRARWGLLTPQVLLQQKAERTCFFHPSIHPSIHPPTHPSIHPSIHPSVCLESCDSLTLHLPLSWKSEHPLKLRSLCVITQDKF